MLNREHCAQYTLLNREYWYIIIVEVTICQYQKQRKGQMQSMIKST